ncbi:TIGR02302 family protein [Bradyrhizobium sp. WD16]|uniref:TIGR02302 family protein n=1 Tax=Bradyrhizobium sp. WD16 TaxID=1521768 RepID=UPI0020A5DD71|nr:TIGR02302 family protein [Bradyrhizobium sp. WD16]UTD27603.1 TIGR02302 family protein [Bradyrhizobium sp. WD16]
MDCLEEPGLSPTPSNPSELTRLRLAHALRRARWVIAWERLWPNLARLLTVAGLFLAASWSGLWLSLPVPGRIVGVVVFALVLAATLVPVARLRWPTREDALRRLDRGSGQRHRPATALTDTLHSDDPISRALWEVQRERTLASLRRVRAGLPSPRLVLHDPKALRALALVLVAATFVAAGGERLARIAAAFDWNGMLTGAEIRIDAWVSPPSYTGRPPVILTAATTGDTAAQPVPSVMSVPAGSTLVVRSSGHTLDVATAGGLSVAPAAAEAPKGAVEHRFTIAADGTAQVRAPAAKPVWTFKTQPDRPPTIALAKDPERQAHGALLLAYKIDDDYGVTEAQAHFAPQVAPQAAPNGAPAEKADGIQGKAAPRPLFDSPQFPLVLPNARTRSGVGQTVKDLSEHPYAGAELALTLTARDEAGNEGKSEPFVMRLPERVFAKPLPRALIELRRLLALDAGQRAKVAMALDAMMLAPELFTPEFGQYLGLRDVSAELNRARTDDDLREVVASLWALAVSIEDGNISDVEKALRAAQDALKQALERGASDEEIKKLTDQLRAALDNYMRQLAEQLRNNPQQLARPLDRNTRVMRQQDLNNMIDRMERLSRSGDKDAARQLLDQMQQMLENLQMAQPGQSGDGDMEQSLNELGDVIRKQQQLRDRTFKQGQDSRRDRMRGQGADQNAMNDLRRGQQGLRDRLKKLLDQLDKQGMGPGQRGNKGNQDEQAQQGQGKQGQGDQSGGLEDADSAMGDADGRLGEGNADGAVDSQGRALEALRKGAQQLAQSMQQQGEGQGEGQGTQLGRQQGGGPDADPLGRPLRGRDHADDYTVKIPGEIDVQRVRRILEELRRRLADPQRSQTELDYIERLLKDY